MPEKIRMQKSQENSWPAMKEPGVDEVSEATEKESGVDEVSEAAEKEPGTGTTPAAQYENSEYRSQPLILEEYSTEGTDPLALEKTYAELIVGIVIWTVLFAIAIVAIRPSPIYDLLGLAVGAILALAMSVSMKRTVEQAVDIGEGQAEMVIKKWALIRYAVAVIVMGVLMIFPIGNPLCAFLGVMTLKVSAYTQPFTHKFLKNIKIRR